MKYKLKKWHIMLMSFMALFIAIFASLFSLKADTVDEETGEIITDNWEISTVFYDSSVNAGQTPLTEINWDASDGSYKEGTSRIITVQINYKNNSAVTTYQPGDLEISIPNLVYSNSEINNTSYDAFWDSSIVVGANDDVHTNYKWNFSSGNLPLREQEIFTFTNAITFEEETNFEGSIQIQYTITPKTEYSSYCYVEEYLDECIHNYNLNLSTTLSYLKNTEQIKINSNKIIFNYTRTYIHPWKYMPYSLSKSANKITSYDGLGNNATDYTWVVYKITAYQYNYTNYPFIGLNQNIATIKDTFPSDCVVIQNGEVLTGIQNQTDNTKIDYEFTELDISHLSVSQTIYVGYPKSIYNEEAGNLSITNYAELWGTYDNKIESEKLASATVSLNLINFSFEYSGNLYSILKENQLFDTDRKYYSQLLLDPDFFHDCGYCFEGHATTSFRWDISGTVKYTGIPMTIKLGDDLLYITTNTGYRKLEDDEYFYNNIRLPRIKNDMNQIVPYNKYTSSLYVKYQNESDYIYYMNLTNSLHGDTITFDSDKKVVAWYIQIEDAVENLNYEQHFSNSATGICLSIKPKDNISSSGNIYNFAYLQVFFKDHDNLILQNEPTIENYENLITKQEIAEYDLNTYGTYIQRATNNISYEDFVDFAPEIKSSIYKTMTNFIQDQKEKIFTGSATLNLSYSSDLKLMDVYKDQDYLQKVYFNNKEKLNYLEKFISYDLLPEGMTLSSTTEELINSITLKTTTNYGTPTLKYLYDVNGNQAFNSEKEYKDFLKEHIKITITENWNNTNRTKIEWVVDFTEKPVIFLAEPYNYTHTISLTYKYFVSYDYYLEQGSVWDNYAYLEGFYRSNKKINISSSIGIKDNGYYDPDAKDINKNNNTSEYLSYSKASKTITDIISTHQDVTIFVKTDQSNYSTGTVTASNSSNYDYKLRVRTGTSNITDLIIYTNIEEAQKGRDRWRGKFIDIDTSYAEKQGYIIKPYYSENPAAGNLYNEDGTLNSDWKEYIPDTPEIIGNGLVITFDENFATYNSSDYLYIYYYYNDKLYRSGPYYGTTLAEKTIEIPSTDVYFYWHTNSYINNSYGFKIKTIKPAIVTTSSGIVLSDLPNYTITEISGLDYPETSHNPYDNNTDKLWHYTYTENLIVQEHQENMDKTKVKSLAFKYIDNTGNPAILPINSLTYVLVKMKSLDDPSETRLARMDCWTQWTALNEFNEPVDFVTGINSNIVKVALPNSIKEENISFISLKFTKEIIGTDSEFENIKLDKAIQQTFLIKLTSLIANEDGTYNQITALLRSDQELIISQIPIGTYLLEELGDNYFDFVDFTDNNNPEIIIEGVTFERTDQGYIITVSEDLAENIEFNIKVTNEIEDERFYEYKDNKENLFLKNKIESEDA